MDKEVFKNVCEFADKNFPSGAPHHTVVMTHKEYLKYKKQKTLFECIKRNEE